MLRGIVHSHWLKRSSYLGLGIGLAFLGYFLDDIRLAASKAMIIGFVLGGIVRYLYEDRTVPHPGPSSN
jgi:hypothetical protein